MGKSQKNKGKRDKREAARKLTRLLGVLVQRTQQFEETFQSADIEDPLVLHLDVKWTPALLFQGKPRSAAVDPS
jgi:hypothetical protein